MNEAPTDWVIVWQRRLRYDLDDGLAQELSEALGMRIRTFERPDDRALGERALRVSGEIAFLTVESDDFEAPIVRLVGPSSLRTDLLALSEEFDEAISRLEAARRRPPSRHGTPLWVPFPDAADSNSAQLVVSTEDPDESFLLWPEAFVPDHREQQVARLGLIVNSVEDAINSGVLAGGRQLTDIITLAAGDFAVVSAPGGAAILLWRRTERYFGLDEIAVSARLDVRTHHMADTVNFFQSIAGWRTEVVIGDPLTVLFTHQGVRVGIVTEDPERTEHEISVLSRYPQTLIRRAVETQEYAVQSVPLRFPLGRRWSITDTGGYRLWLAEEPGADATGSRLRQSWLHLPTVVLIAVADLKASLDLPERSLKEILLSVPAPLASEQSSALLGVFRSALDPAASKLVGLLEGSDHPGQILEVLSAQRPAVQGLIDDVRLVAQSLENEELISAYQYTRALLVRSGLLADAPGAIEETSVQL
jgi:predicted enzyme related to lactoylglutathione lyase